MADELLKLRGRLAVNEQLQITLATGIDVDIDEARSLLDKYVPKSELQADRIKVVIWRLCESIERLREVQVQTASIKRDIGQ